MNNENVHFSSKSNEWETPQAFFDKLNAEFHFTLDPCCTHENACSWFVLHLSLSKSLAGCKVVGSNTWVAPKV